MTYLDLNQEPVAYVFSVVRDSQDVGYVVIGVHTYPNAVLEWSSSPARHLAGIQNCEHIASDLDLTLLNGRFFYLGALSYYCIAASESTVQQLSDGKPPTGQVVLVDMNDSRTVFLSPEGFTESTSTEPLPFSESVNGVDQDNLLALDAILGFKQLDVPTYYQHCYGGCYVGCGPTAAGTLMGYWSSRGYPSLMSGGSQAVIERLHDLADTECCGSATVCGNPGYGCTWWDDIDEAMEAFVSERGYTGQSSYISWPTFAQYKSEINADRPVVLGLMGHEDWGDHIVTGVGYNDDSGQYMIVNPNWSGSEVTSIQYGQGYSSIGMDTLTLSGGPPPCPPEDCTPGNEVGRDFFVEVVERLADVPVSDFAVDALALWEPYENTAACWNPLATTWEMEVVCDFNSAGVQHYQSQDMGTQATANTLALGYYDDIRRMLRLEAFDREGLRADLGVWGTCSGQGCNSLLNEWEALWNAQGGDATPPSGNITSPSSDSAFRDSLTATSDASDSESGVNRVDFYLYYDGAQHQQTDNDGGNGWSVTWDLSGVAEQSGMWLDAWIYDNCGNSHHTNVVSGLMIDRTNPSGGITSPSSNSTFSDSLTAISDATDDRSGVNRVDFYLYYDGAQHPKTDNNGSDGWSVTWDLSGVAEQSGMWLDAWIYDNAGNSHHTNVVTDLRIDRSAPTPTSTPEPGDTTPPTNPTSCIELNGAQNNVWQNSIGHPAFVWSGADGTGSDIAGYYHTFSTDPNGTSDYFTTSNTFDFDFSTGWPTGVPYYLRVRTKDTSGNLATEWKTIFIFKYDPVPPTVSFDRANGIPISASGQSVYSNVTNWTFEGTANDSGAGLDSIVFGGWGNNYGYGWNDTAGTSSPWSYSQNGLLGHNRIHFWSVDKAGNESERKYIELYVDTAAPDTAALLNGTMGNEGWYLSPVEVTLNASDNGSGGSGTIGGIPNRFTAGIGVTSYRIDSGAWQTYSGSFTVSGDGTHTVDYYSVDAVGNEESTQSLTIKIDTNPPSGSLSINRGASTSYSLNVVLGPSASDGSGSGVSQMRFGNSNPDWSGWEAYAPEKAWRLTDGSGSKTVYVQFQDTAGNTSSGYSAPIVVDLYPDRPASQNYRIFKSVVGIGGEGKSSENYKAGNTTGQPAMGPAPERSQSSESFRLVTGYWAMQPWPLSGDFNHDCKIDVEDIMQVASRWRTSCAIPDPDHDVNTPNYEKMYDIDRDCDIDIVDIMKVVVHWGETCP